MKSKFFSSDKPLEVEATRSGRREAIHFAHVVLCNSAGELLGSFGDPGYQTYERSLAKPIQLLTAITLRPSLLDECSDAEISLMSASHSGEEKHIEALCNLYNRYGLNEDQFTCGTHPPFVPDAIWKLGRKSIETTPVYHNCSGKHISMLLACEAQGFPMVGYEMPDHPLQMENHKTMARYAGMKLEDLEYGVDGCGVPTWWLNLRAIATASARYADPEFAEGELEGTIKDRVFEAYHKASWYTAGTGRFGTPFNAESDGKWLGKIGGESVFGVSFRNRGLGIGIKVMDGNSRALGPPLLYAMKKWDLVSEDQLDRLKDWVNVERFNAPKTFIGWMRVVE